jgi:hypothetical protein
MKSQLLSLAIAIAVVGIVLNGAVEMEPMSLSDDPPADFEQYCHSVVGEEADIYLANDAAIAAHNGWHCSGEDRTIHRTQIPSDVWDRYERGDVGESYVTNHLRRPPGLIGFLWWRPWTTATLGFVSVGAVGVVAWAGSTDNSEGGS